MATYLPYAHHQKKVLVKQAVREITQSLSDARNLAINGLSGSSGSNLNIALYFSSGSTSIQYYTSTGILDMTSISPWNLLKVKHLPRWTQIDSIAGNISQQIFWFSALTGDGFTDPDIWDNPIDFQVSFKWSSDVVLQKVIQYYPKSYISDY